MKIPLHEPLFKKKEFLQVKSCFKKGWLSAGGYYVNKFEKEISKVHKIKYSSCLLNCTAALQVSLRCLNVGFGDEVLVPTVTFVSTVNSIIYNNASPVFFDVDKNFNIDESKVLEFLKKKTKFSNNFTYNKRSKKIIKAIIIVHVFGNPANFEKIYDECKKRNIKIIEDAAESLGSKYISGKFKNKYTGTIGDLGCISFNGNKIISSGGGGAIITNNKKLKDRIDYLINQAKNDSINFIHNEVGYNFKMTNLHAAVGSANLINIKNYILKKKEIHKCYASKIKNNKNIRLNLAYKNSEPNYWLNVIITNTFNNKKKILNKLIKNKIQARSVWYPNHLQKPYKKYQRYKIEKASLLVRNSICLPSSPNITKKQLNKIVKILND
jgi:perosamine synthetase